MNRTALYEEHKTLGAKLVPFGGFEMPVSYPAGIKKECYAVRNDVGIFDVSHMGEFQVKGNNAEIFLQTMLTNDVLKLNMGDAQYTVMCYDNGGIVDDLILYKIQDGYLLVVNASNIEKDFNWLEDHLQTNVILENLSDDCSLIAVQGPRSRSLIESILSEKQPQKFYTFNYLNFQDEEIMVSRTGYTGELGFEIMGPHEIIKQFWKDCINGGAAPIGLAARDILRMEMKYCLYGNDMDQNTTPIEAGLSWITSFDKGRFVGKDSMLNKKNRGKSIKLVAFEMLERGIPRKDYEIYIGDQCTGKVTSGTQSPTLNNGIGMGFVSADMSNPEQEIDILIRDKKTNAKIVKPPFIKHTSLFN